MKTKIFSLIMLLFLTSCFFDSNKDDEIVPVVEEKVVEEKIVEVGTYDETKDLGLKDKVKIKGGFVLTTNMLNNIISSCDFLEGKSDYLLENGEKEVQTKSEIELAISALKEEERMEEVEDLEALVSGKIQGKYEFIRDKNFDRDNFTNSTEFYTYLGHFIYFHDDKEEANTYIDLYLEELNKEEEITKENFILPLIAGNYSQNKTCKSFIETNFISY